MVSSGNKTSAEPLDAQDIVGYAAQLLQVSEYRFFHAAHRFWFGHELSEEWMRPLYADYLLRGTVPYWAAHLARRIMDKAASGTLDPLQFGIEPPAPLDEDARALGMFYLVLFGVFMVAYVALLIYGVPSV